MTSASGSGKKKNPYYQGPASDHFDGLRFFNPGGVGPGSPLDLLKWQFAGGRVRWPNPVISAFPSAKPDRHVFGDQMRVTMVGHASMLVQIAGLNMLTDPVWSERVSPFRSIGPKRVVPPGIRFEDLPPIDLVLVSHNHYDHLDLATLASLQARQRPKIVTPLGNDTIIRRAVPDAEIVVVDWGDRIAVNGGVTIDVEPCHHWSARGMGDRRMALWAAFVLTTPAGRIYHVGDTGFHDGINYEAVRQKHGGFRLAILPFGAYEPRWFMKGQHQNPAEAVEGMKICGAAHVCGHHWGTVQLTDEAVEAPLVALKAALAEQGIDESRFQPMRPGEVFDVPSA